MVSSEKSKQLHAKILTERKYLAESFLLFGTQLIPNHSVLRSNAHIKRIDHVWFFQIPFKVWGVKKFPYRGRGLGGCKKYPKHPYVMYIMYINVPYRIDKYFYKNFLPQHAVRCTLLLKWFINRVLSRFFLSSWTLNHKRI